MERRATRYNTEDLTDNESLQGCIAMEHTQLNIGSYPQDTHTKFEPHGKLWPLGDESVSVQARQC